MELVCHQAHSLEIFFLHVSLQLITTNNLPQKVYVEL
jgi:hypothetical protein